ncbi:MAG: ABC transporter [Clostridia bacterium]|nr:ABC transporter [Clostridia bacterium]
MSAIFKREMLSYFTGAIGYVFIAVFLALTGGVFGVCTLFMGKQSSVSLFFTVMLFIYGIIVPLLTMKSFSEERKTRTEQLLLTSPVSLTGMVMGKFFSAYSMFAGSFVLSCINFYTLFRYGTPNVAVLVSYCIGILLIGAAYVAIGLFISALTENQLIAAIATIGTLIVMLVMSFVNQYIDFYPVRFILSWISIYSRFSNFTFGILDISSLLYYFSICFIFLFLTVRVYEKRRWS